MDFIRGSPVVDSKAFKMATTKVRLYFVDLIPGLLCSGVPYRLRDGGRSEYMGLHILIQVLCTSSTTVPIIYLISISMDSVHHILNSESFEQVHWSVGKAFLFRGNLKRFLCINLQI